MSEEKKTEVTEEVKEARKLSMEELENVNGGGKEDLAKKSQWISFGTFDYDPFDY